MIPTNRWCGSAQKVRYPNEKEATEALQRCWSRGWNQKDCYEHSLDSGGCGGWHLTSRSDRHYEQVSKPLIDNVLATYEPFAPKSQRKKAKRVCRATVSQTLLQVEKDFLDE